MKIFSALAQNKGLAIGLTVASVVMFVGSLLAVPWLVARAPLSSETLLFHRSDRFDNLSKSTASVFRATKK